MYATTAIRAAGAVPAYAEIDEATLLDRGSPRPRAARTGGDRHPSLDASPTSTRSSASRASAASR
jgi:hypothetical protein